MSRRKRQDFSLQDKLWAIEHKEKHPKLTAAALCKALADHLTEQQGDGEPPVEPPKSSVQCISTCVLAMQVLQFSVNVITLLFVPEKRVFYLMRYLNNQRIVTFHFLLEHANPSSGRQVRT